VPELQATGDSPENVANDRRRPGRTDPVNPTLIPLLRAAPTPGLPLKDNTGLAQAQRELAPAARVAFSLLLSTLLWAAIGFVGWTITH